MLALVIAAACSRSADKPAISDDLKADLDRVGGSSDMQLAGANGRKVDVVSASERINSPAPAPHAPTVAKAPAAMHGTVAPIRSAKPVTPAPAESKADAQEVAPAEQPKAEPVPEPIQSQGRPRAPLPSTQREPRGGWKTPGEIIRRAPFPINP
jgi:hypothetical protein